MNNNPTAVETLFEKIEDYTKTTIELTKLKTIDKSADVLSSLISRLIVSLAAGMFMLLLNFGLSYWIGEMLGNSYYGFFIVALFYLLVSIILYTNRNSWIKLPISNSIIAKILKNR
jgi:tetrahydromethanopterin S-methyltransferase subunit B